ncbi:sodium channel protein Nach-like [Trichoplusia ni]|uniref:Sodium channel protein Nach-like n=1 Tax=Trichoplusia ni TaxID=7111 RepID=A0A7E5WD07_TRINI|nr:sodium channel protein Nach-like [Trichoplusia ni]
MNFLKLLYHAQFHGANRLADRTSRWYFIPPMLMLLLSSIMLVIFTVNRYLSNPTYIVHMEKLIRTRSFPSVVLCPEIAFLESKMDEFLSELKYPTGMNASDFRDILPQLAAFYAPDMLYELDDLMRLEELLIYNDINVEQAGLRLTSTCEETIIRCRFGRKFLNCSEIFTMEMTGAGFCCVFNGRSLRREMQENGEGKKSKPVTNSTRWKTSHFGYSSGLMLAVNQSQLKPLNIDLYYKWIALQTSQHFVDTANNGSVLNPGCEQWIAYYTNSFNIGVEVKELSTSLRKCYLSVDGLLEYFPIYNKRYCLLECEMANTMKACKCLRTAHLQPPGATQCRAAKLRCATHAMVPYDTELCNCLSTCEVEMVYTNVASFDLNSMVKPLDSFYDDLDFDKVTIVRVFIENRKQNVRQRTSYFSYMDLFSQLGGVFNVFFGCSILTLLGFIQIGWRTMLVPFKKQ